MAKAATAKSAPTLDTNELVQLYARGRGEDIGALAVAFEVDEATVIGHLKKARVYVEPAGQLSDDDLGIGEDDDLPAAASSGDPLAELLKRPELQALIEAAVAQRMANMGVSAEPAAVPQTPQEGLQAVVKSIERIVEAQAQQIPGYQRPLSAEELEARAAAYVEMKSLIAHSRQRNEYPHYVIGPQGLFDSAECQRYDEGQEIRTFIEPVEDFIPMNEPARQIHAAFIRHIGGPTPEIGAQIAAAMLAAKGKDVPIVGESGRNLSGPKSIELIQSAQRPTNPRKRMLGTITPEAVPTNGLPSQPGITPAPAGPVFVG